MNHSLKQKPVLGKSWQLGKRNTGRLECKRYWSRQIYRGLSLSTYSFRSLTLVICSPFSFSSKLGHSQRIQQKHRCWEGRLLSKTERKQTKVFHRKDNVWNWQSSKRWIFLFFKRKTYIFFQIGFQLLMILMRYGFLQTLTNRSFWIKEFQRTRFLCLESPLTINTLIHTKQRKCWTCFCVWRMVMMQ